MLQESKVKTKIELQASLDVILNSSIALGFVQNVIYLLACLLLEGRVLLGFVGFVLFGHLTDIKFEMLSVDFLLGKTSSCHDHEMLLIQPPSLILLGTKKGTEKHCLSACFVSNLLRMNKRVKGRECNRYRETFSSSGLKTSYHLSVSLCVRIQIQVFHICAVLHLVFWISKIFQIIQTLP